MLNLKETTLWGQLSGPGCTSDKIPALIKKLQEHPDKKIFNKICWDYIYHQNTLYECTFAAIPYLTEIALQSNDYEFQWLAFTSVGVLLAELDKEDKYLNEIFKNTTLEEHVVKDIISDYKNSLGKLSLLGEKVTAKIPRKDDEDKIYLIITLAALNGVYDAAKLFGEFPENDEYVGICGDLEFYFENTGRKLVVYGDDPVFNTHQKAMKVTPHPAVEPSSEIREDNKMEWLTYYVDKFNMKSYKPIIPYLFGTINCPKCSKEHNVYDLITAI